MTFVVRTLSRIQRLAFFGLLVFAPLASGATSRWAFCISVWLGTLAISAMLMKRLWQHQSLLPRTPLSFPLAVLLLLAFASLFTSIYPAASGWALVRLALYASTFYLTLDIMASRKETEQLLLLIFCLGAFLASFGFVKYAGGPVPSFWVNSGTGIESQLTATFYNHNHLAGYLEIVFSLGLGLLLLDRPIFHPLLWSFLLLLILSALFFSMSRGGWIAVLVASGLMLTIAALKRGLRPQKAAVIVSAFVLIAGFSFLGSNAMIDRLESLKNLDEPNIAAIRIPVWAGCLRLIGAHPWLGTGLGTFPWSFPAVRPAGLGWRFREAHNDYLQIVTELGLPVLLPLLWGLCLLFRSAFQNLHEDQSGKFRIGVTLGALGGIAAILVHSLFDFNIQITSNGVLFSVLVGMIPGQRSHPGIP